MDFQRDPFSRRRHFHFSAVVDDCARERLALAADTSLPSLGVVRVAVRGRPAMCTDNGTEPEQSSDKAKIGAQVMSCKDRVAKID